jgi:hypothetical protein
MTATPTINQYKRGNKNSTATTTKSSNKNSHSNINSDRMTATINQHNNKNSGNINSHSNDNNSSHECNTTNTQQQKSGNKNSCSNGNNNSNCCNSLILFAVTVVCSCGNFFVCLFSVQRPCDFLHYNSFLSNEDISITIERFCGFTVTFLQVGRWFLQNRDLPLN